ncbi:MAG: YdcF family protein [Gomphosphaeria aponina SAG 52.96 = DSM 107014]|uniref:YdcF family protein n=1 Tax=Gomphosphaeria aponina SAG 52.96 = DSM 107014 TaxID=1521640 RepID=A0A941JTT1_9CHRO|nr:YdcF family protein [Gomphosphaeria aponina SAG 52.96 = DSM 107014]
MKIFGYKITFSAKWLVTIAFLLLSVRFIIIPLQIAIAFYQYPHPQSIFVLGGNIEREKAAAQLAKTYKNLPIVISSGNPPKYTKAIFQEAGVELSRLHLDYCAVDTVTNFTCSVSYFKQRNIHHVYLLTSDFHLPRAKAIAFFIFGSQGIAVTPISISSERASESRLSLLRDSFRSLVWVATGRSLISFHPRSRNQSGNFNTQNLINIEHHVTS